MKFVTLTADESGLYVGTSQRDVRMSIVYTGDFGGGTLTFGVLSPIDTFFDFTDPAPVGAKGNIRELFLGKGTKFAITLSSSTNPILVVGFAAENFEFDKSLYQL